MEITVSGEIVYVEVSKCGWLGKVNRIGSFQAPTLGLLVELIKTTLERI